VLAQHTLGYLFPAKPQDRTGYFKALLEVTDLDEFRNAVAALEKESEVIQGPLSADFYPVPNRVQFHHVGDQLARPIFGLHVLAVPPAFNRS
jgi:hypothetical protein